MTEVPVRQLPSQAFAPLPFPSRRSSKFSKIRSGCIKSVGMLNAIALILDLRSTDKISLIPPGCRHCHDFYLLRVVPYLSRRNQLFHSIRSFSHSFFVLLFPSFIPNKNSGIIKKWELALTSTFYAACVVHPLRKEELIYHT